MEQKLGKQIFGYLLIVCPFADLIKRVYDFKKLKCDKPLISSPGKIKEVFENYFKGAIESKGAYVIIDARTNAIIGSSRFYDYDVKSKEVKIGYTFFARSVWGQYHNKTTKLLMLDHAFNLVDRVIFHVGSQNYRSRRAMEKLGAKIISLLVYFLLGDANTIFASGGK